jgi:hypothetical protein
MSIESVGAAQLLEQSDAAARSAASTDALKTTYYVLIGIAFTEALNRVFIKNDQFLGEHVFDRANLPSLLLLCAFLPTVTRLVHGASIHFALRTRRFKALVDFTAFFLQASVLYVMALSIERVRLFSFEFAVLLAGDIAWLLFLRAISYISLGPIEKQWIWSDSVVALMMVAAALRLGALAASALVVVVSCAATALDYRMNRDFYFPKPMAANPAGV